MQKLLEFLALAGLQVPDWLRLYQAFVNTEGYELVVSTRYQALELSFNGYVRSNTTTTTVNHLIRYFFERFYSDNGSRPVPEYIRLYKKNGYISLLRVKMFSVHWIIWTCTTALAVALY